jgi:hypothetical protein
LLKKLEGMGSDNKDHKPILKIVSMLAKTIKASASQLKETASDISNAQIQIAAQANKPSPTKPSAEAATTAATTAALTASIVEAADTVDGTKAPDVVKAATPQDAAA